MTFSRVALVALCLMPACAGRQGTAPPPPVASAQSAIPLWVTGAPSALGTDTLDRPEMTPYLPRQERANGTAVVIFPGGGYQHLVMGHAGIDVANLLSRRGITSFLAFYPPFTL